MAEEKVTKRQKRKELRENKPSLNRNTQFNLFRFISTCDLEVVKR